MHLSVINCINRINHLTSQNTGIAGLLLPRSVCLYQCVTLVIVWFHQKTKNKILTDQGNDFTRGVWLIWAALLEHYLAHIKLISHQKKMSDRKVKSFKYH